MLRSSDFNLRKLHERDLPDVFAWRNSNRVRHNMFNSHLISWEEHQSWFARVKNDNKNIYMIFECQGTPIGVTYFTNINWRDKVGFWGFYLGMDSLPRGTGAVMGWFSLEYAFAILELRKLSGEVFSFNLASVSLFKKMGFFEEGRFREHVYKEGLFEDVIFLSLLKRDWERDKSKVEKLIFIERPSYELCDS